MDYKKILNGVLSATLKTDDGKVAELLKNGEEELTEEQVVAKILEMDVDRVQSIKKDSAKETFQDGYKKAKKEVLTEWENEIKDKFGVESSKMGLDLINEIVEQTSKPSDDTTEEAIRRSKLYLDLESQMKDKIKEVEREKEEAINEIKSNYEGEKVLSKVNEKALEVLNSLNPILPSNQNVAKNQTEAFLNKFKGYKFELQGDRIVTMDEEGKVLKDPHGSTLVFEDIVKDKASNFFEFAKNNGGAGSGNEGNEDGNSTEIKVPTNLKELTDIMNDDSIEGSERLKIAEAYENANKN